MTTLEINLYTFDELNETVQQRLVDNIVAIYGAKNNVMSDESARELLSAQKIEYLENGKPFTEDTIKQFIIKHEDD